MKRLLTLLTLIVAYSTSSATPIYMKIEDVKGESKVAQVDRNGACTFDNLKPGNYKVTLLLPAVQNQGAAQRGKDDSHKEWIEVLSWSWGTTNMGSADGSVRRETSSPTLGEIVVTKQADKASPILAKGASKGTSRHELKNKTTHQGDEYYAIKMTDVLISGQSPSARGSSEWPTETVSMVFQKIEWNYKPNNAESPAIERGSWNLKENTK